MDRRSFLKAIGAGAASLTINGCFDNMKSSSAGSVGNRPNILFCIADDWGWPHAGAYGDKVVKTPAFDRLARKGVLFENAFVSSPSCTPCRNSILTGQHFYRLKEGANLWSTLDVNIPVYPLILEAAGYHVGYWRKSWGPGYLEKGGYIDAHPVVKEYSRGFKQFLDARKPNQPFCFWLGADDPHRPYKKGSGRKSGIPVDKIQVPDFYPDVEDIRSDIADYYFEVQRFDRDCGRAIKLLEEIGELGNTIIVMTGDNGMPFPRCKTNLYDMGVRVPLAISWPRMIKPKRRVTDYVSLPDLCPTFLELAGIKVPGSVTARSLLPVLLSNKNGRVDIKRDHVIFGRERHTPAQAKPSLDGYPCRGIRTDEYLYIRNFKPDRWPAGVPEGATHSIGVFSDVDDSPTKSYLIDNRMDPVVKRYYDLSFSKRPGEELFSITKDRFQINNVAADPQYSQIKAKLAARLIVELKSTDDPRVVGGGEKFDEYPYFE